MTNIYITNTMLTEALLISQIYVSLFSFNLLMNIRVLVIVFEL